MRYKVIEDDTLLNFLLSHIDNMSKNNIKSLLSNKCVYINDKMTSKYDYHLNRNDEVYIAKFIKNGYSQIEIVYEDKDIIVVNKPEKLLTISTGKEKYNTLYNIVSSYVKRNNKNNKIFIVHRLDKDTSGIVMFAKNIKVQKLLQDRWNDIVYREYIALVHHEVKESKALKDYLAINKEGNSYLSNKEEGKLAITNYDVMESKNHLAILKVIIETGRKNQIRLQLAHDNHPIVGDKKYGIKDKANRMYLHAYKLEFTNPISKKKMVFKTPYPQNFKIKNDLK